MIKTEAAHTQNPGSSSDLLSMVMPNKPEYVGVVRLTVSAVANRMGFNIEEIEDIKVAVAEACTNAIKYSLGESFTVDCEVNPDKLCISVTDTGNGYDPAKVREPDLSDPKEEGGLGIFIIRSLMDEVESSSKPGQGAEIKMIKFLGDGN